MRSFKLYRVLETFRPADPTRNGADRGSWSEPPKKQKVKIIFAQKTPAGLPRVVNQP